MFQPTWYPNLLQIGIIKCSFAQILTSIRDFRINIGILKCICAYIFKTFRKSEFYGVIATVAKSIISNTLKAFRKCNSSKIMNASERIISNTFHSIL